MSETETAKIAFSLRSQLCAVFSVAVEKFADVQCLKRGRGDGGKRGNLSEGLGKKRLRVGGKKNARHKVTEGGGAFASPLIALNSS